MSVWFCIPSARPESEVRPIVDAWRSMNYGVAIFRDTGSYMDYREGDDYVFCMAADYRGYADAVNTLADFILHREPDCDWIITGGDDTLPDTNHTAEEIAAQCTEHFNGTFGVMQPTGDRFASGSIDRIAGSPWMGREWCLRANQGKGPFWPEFTHMFGDECLKRTAEKLGVYWMRPDLVHFHKHFQRETDAIDSPAASRKIPSHLEKWNTPEHWNEMKAIFSRLAAQDFEPCMPLEAHELSKQS